MHATHAHSLVQRALNRRVCLVVVSTTLIPASLTINDTKKQQQQSHSKQVERESFHLARDQCCQVRIK